MKTEFSRQILEKYSNIKFHENPSSRVVPSGKKDVQRDMKKLTVAFRNFANAPKNSKKPTLGQIRNTDIPT